MTAVYTWDIETIGSERGKAMLLEKATPAVQKLLDAKAPQAFREAKTEGQIAKLEAWITAQDEKIAEAQAAAVDRAALNWWTGQIVCVCLIKTESIYSEEYEVKKIYGTDEKKLLVELAEYLELEVNDIPTGKHSELFDRPYVIGRMMANKVRIPQCIKDARVRTPKDVNHIFGFSSACSQITSLNNYAFGLGIEGKLSSGSQVGEMYEAEKWEELIDYCVQDNVIVLEMLRRYLR